MTVRPTAKRGTASSSVLKLTLAYDGTGFGGWQRQAHDSSIQERLEEAIRKIAGRRVVVHGASRTDAGVHALGQCASFEPGSSKLSPRDWIRAINAHLPPTIRVLRCSRAPSTFHAQFKAKGKLYRYRIWNDPVLPPFEHGRAWQQPVALNFAAMKKAARPLVGKHDFSAFASQSRDPRQSNVRTIRRIALRKTGPLVEIEVRGDGFLYKMVRGIAGTLVDVGKGRIPASETARILAGKDRKRAGQNAPAQGLFLVKVLY